MIGSSECVERTVKMENLRKKRVGSVLQILLPETLPGITKIVDLEITFFFSHKIYF